MSSVCLVWCPFSAPCIYTLILNNYNGNNTHNALNLMCKECYTFCFVCHYNYIQTDTHRHIHQPIFSVKRRWWWWWYL